MALFDGSSSCAEPQTSRVADMRARIILAAVLVVTLTACATRNTRAPLPFLERFYVGKVSSDSSMMYEANAAAHVLLIDQLPNAYDHISQDRAANKTASAWRVIVSPMFIIRQLNDSSAAVRTPSFMPRLAVEWMHVSRAGKITPPEPVIGFSMVRVSGIRLGLQHHSNGQAGCFRAGYVPVDRRAQTCVPAVGTDTTPVVLNRSDGDFSSTYLQMVGHSTWMNRGSARVPTWSAGGAAALALHPPFLFGALSDEQRSLYGSWRLHLLGEGMWHSGISCSDPGPHARKCFLAGRARLTGEYVRAPNRSNDFARRVSPAIIPFRWSVEASHSLDRLLGAGPFVRYTDGQDYYNIGFVNRRRGVMWGLMLDLSGPDRIARTSQLP